MPVAAAGDVVQASAFVKSSGLGNGATVALEISDYNASGTLIGSTTVLQTLTISGGVQIGFPGAGAAPNLSGSHTTQANTAYVGVAVHVKDTVAANSANGTVWVDNVQVWDQTKTGMSSMPYCELRFAQSPATLVLSGLLGDLPAPVHLGLGTYLASWAKGSTLSYAIGRRAQASANFVGCGSSHGFYGTVFTPTGTAVLDSAGYGGFFVKATVNTGGWNPRGLSVKASDALGVFHVLGRYRTADATPSGVQVRVQTEELLDPWYQDVATLKTIGIYFGPYVNPLSAASVWTVADAGQAQVPPFLRGALRDDTQIFEVPRGQWVGTTGGGAEGDASWLALLPVDGSLVAGVLNNPSNSPVAAVNTSWVWTYLDGLLVNRAGSGPGGQQDSPGWTYSIEGAPLSAPGHGAGGPGTQGTGAINVNNGADPYLSVDPTIDIAGQGGAGGVNQLVGYVSDNTGDVLPMHAQVMYSPLYLWPR
jgi:hypothetical protein